MLFCGEMTSESQKPWSGAWDQFLIGRRQMLADYARAREHSSGLPVQVAHGHVAEATFRAWLESFLPKRFGVTPGYIRGQQLNTPYHHAHFDVIIYDQLNAPVLGFKSNTAKA